MRKTLPPIFGKLGEVLAKSPSHPFGYALYLPHDEEWEVNTRCALIDPDDVESDDQEDPVTAAEAGLAYALDGGAVKGIYENVAQQRGLAPTAEDLLVAFLYYYDNDAFVTIVDA